MLSIFDMDRDCRYVPKGIQSRLQVNRFGKKVPLPCKPGLQAGAILQVFQNWFICGNLSG